ncbi:TPA: hypothetical protein ACH3X2_003553 [Trebouxia sp. C0005]|nr:MAG: eukaryotic translation initiation factor 3 [Trebouxia sp. A1-2]
MAEDWEDWENDDFTPQLPAVAAPQVAAADQVEDSKFAGEDEEEDKPEYNVPKPQQSKPGKKKTYEDKDKASRIEDEPLDDPVAEKLRQQRLIEESDLQNAKELFGNARGASASALDAFEPKSLKDHEELARFIAQQYLLPHSKNQHYKTLLKALLKQACLPVALPEVKDLETCIAGIKSDKIKEDKAAKEAKKVAGKKKNVNVGSKGGSAGLDDYKYDEALDDADDFM